MGVATQNKLLKKKSGFEGLPWRKGSTKS